MKLIDWLKGDESAKPPRSRVTHAEFARRIGCSVTLISGYCNGTVWPGHDKMAAIMRETAGAVGANDFVQIQAAE